MTTKKTPLIFAPGTLVRHKTRNETGLIEEVSLDTGQIDYSWNGSAWHNHSEFEFIKAPTKESIKKVMQSMYDELEADDD